MKYIKYSIRDATLGYICEQASNVVWSSVFLEIIAPMVNLLYECKLSIKLSNNQYETHTKYSLTKALHKIQTLIQFLPLQI